MLDITRNEQCDFPCVEADQLCSKITKGTTPPNSDDVEQGPVPFVRVNNLTLGGKIGLAGSIIFVPERIHRGFLSRSISFPGDILMNIVGPPLGKVAFLTDDFDEYNLNQAIIIYRPNESRVDPLFLYYYLCSHQAQSWLEARSKKTSGQRNLTIELCKRLPIPQPSLQQQRCIAEILRTWDEAIDKTQRLIASKVVAFDHWSRALLTGRRRLARNRKNWQSLSLTEVAREATARNGAGRLDVGAVMGVNKLHGMVPMKDHVRAADLSRYKIVRPGAFAYNPMRLNIGSIAQNLHGRDVLVSPDYVAFETLPDSLLPAYFDHLRRTPIWSRFVKSAGSGGVRIRIYYDDLADFVLDLPPPDEQARIVEVLNTARQEIDILERQRDALIQQKRGLMQKLLTGEWTVKVPESQEAAE